MSFKNDYRQLKHEHTERFTKLLRSVTKDEAFNISTKCMSSHPSIDLLKAGVKDEFDPYDVAYYVEYKGHKEYIDDKFSYKEEMECVIEALLRKENEQ